MTAQIPDTFIFQGYQYSLIEITGNNLASLNKFGMEPKVIDTSCYRGYYATYELKENALYLKELTVREKNKHYPPIDGIKPIKDGCKASYSNLCIAVYFSGKILLAKDFIHELYIHMGYQRPIAFKKVLDITLQDGKIVNIKDRSKEIKIIRNSRGEI